MADQETHERLCNDLADKIADTIVAFFEHPDVGVEGIDLGVVLDALTVHQARVIAKGMDDDMDRNRALGMLVRALVSNIETYADG